MSAPSASDRAPAARGRRRGVSISVLLLIAIGIPVLVMATLTARAVLARASCAARPLLLNVAVSPDLAPAAERVARLYDRRPHQVAGRCAQVQVTEETPATVAGQLDGQHPAAGTPAADAWIPDSSLWIDVSRSFPMGARMIRTAGFSVAQSPLVLAMPAGAATRAPEFGASVGWSFLLPPEAGGPPADAHLRVELPDPAQNSAGLATVIQVSRVLGSSAAARTAFARFILSSQATTSFDDPAALATLVSLAAPPLAENPVTVTSEQAVIAYDRQHPGAPLAARYPSGTDRLLGTPQLDYPYVLTTASPALAQVAAQFGRALRTPYATAVIRYDGFRSPDGTGDATPAADGLRSQLLTIAGPASAGQAQSTLETYSKLGLGSNVLTLIDTSAAMARPGSIPGQSTEQELTTAADFGLQLFPDNTRMGLWQFSYHLDGGRPYRQLVSVGPLPAAVGLISRRQQIEQINKTLQASPAAPAALHDAILDAYQQMKRRYYQPGDANTLVLLTAGVDSAPGDLPLSTLLARLRALYDPNRRVDIVAIMFGSGGDFPALRKIAAVTGGSAFRITSPGQVARAFFAGIADRTCNPSCSP